MQRLVTRGLHNLRATSSYTSSSSNAMRTSSSVASHITPWEKKVVSCHGDYREESFLEDPSKPHYENQTSLPRLPIPSVQETLGTFLPTALPLAESQEEAETLEACVKSFAKDSEQLQERLIQRAQEFHDSSWLQHWWNTMGYLQVRDSVVINVSYYFQFSNDPTIQMQSGSSCGDDPQIARAASLIWNMVEYRNLVCSGQLPAEAVGKKKTPLCSTAVKYMFHATRVPKREQDYVNIYDPSRYRHVIVACKGQFFAFDAIDENHQPLSLASLEEKVKECADSAAALANKGTLQLGWLTAANRDEWADGRDLLLQQGGIAMEAALEMLESGAIMVCLDEDSPVSKKDSAYVYLHGNTPGNAGICNRWFDKSIQLVVCKNGKAGLVGEHSMMDGMPVVAFADHITKKTYKDALEGSQNATSAVGGITNIFDGVIGDLEASRNVQDSVNKAKVDFLNFTGAHEIDVQSFHGYGSNFIKKAGYSPDAFVQVAMQLATYRLWGKQGGTYEATQVRPFLHGRTETTRTVSPKSAEFVKCMGLSPKLDEHDEAARKEKLGLLQDAVVSHTKYLKLAGQAKGVDRHFFGLSLCAHEGEALPDLYSHPVFVRSKTWRVSTSNLTHPKLENWGYGEVVPHGVGLSYSVHPRSCVFGITALKEHNWTSKLSGLLEEALLELRSLVEADQTIQSRL